MGEFDCVHGQGSAGIGAARRALSLFHSCHSKLVPTAACYNHDQGSTPRPACNAAGLGVSKRGACRVALRQDAGGADGTRDSGIWRVRRHQLYSIPDRYLWTGPKIHSHGTCATSHTRFMPPCALPFGHLGHCQVNNVGVHKVTTMAIRLSTLFASSL